MGKQRQICCALLPVLSFFGVVSLAWVASALLEIYVNNLTMLKMFDQRAVGEQGSVDQAGANLTDLNQNIFTFVQISDLHISKYRDYGQIKYLEKFCKEVVPIIDPKVALVTGDLTDAKDIWMTGSTQYEEEWKSYHAAMTTCKQNNPILNWLDMRGNHDVFDVPSKEHARNLFNKYGGTQYNKGVHQYVHRTKFGSYAFNGIDLTPTPGLKRPFNFFSVPDQEVITSINELAKESKNFNHTVWYGHYPLSTTIIPHQLRYLLRDGVAYLCGHFHHFVLNSFPRIYASHAEGFLELELGDWKLNRRFRVGVFDHDLFAFKDFSYSEAMDPLIIFTNPLDSRFVNRKTPMYKTRQSSHIRFLIFHQSRVDNVQVSINNDVICNNAMASGNLYTCTWDASGYATGGFHTLSVQITVGEKVWSESIEFSMDSRHALTIRNVLLLLTDFCTLTRMMLLVSAFFTIVLPVYIKLQKKHRHARLLWNLVKELCPQFIAFAQNDRLFWSLITYNVYICIGPLSVGYFISDTIGVLFTWGVYTYGRFLPGTLTCAYSSFQLCVFTLSTMFCIGDILTLRRTSCRVFLALTTLVVWEMSAALAFKMAYGWMAATFNSLNSISVILILYFIRLSKQNN